jgi:signal transduction histidine kinase
VAHGIIEQHNGTLSVESRVGEGTVFTIRLPLREQNRSGD